MHLTILADATCDLPGSVLTRFEADILPTALESLKQSKASILIDDRSQRTTKNDYRKMLAPNAPVWRPLGGDVDAFILSLTDRWLFHSDGLQVVTPTERFSQTHKRLRESAFIVQPELDRRREAVNLKGHYRVRLFDSGQLYAGYGLVMHEALDLHREHRLSIDKLRKPLDAFRKRVHLLYSCPEPVRLHRLGDNRFRELGWLKQQQIRFGSTPLFSLHDDEHLMVDRVAPAGALDHLLHLVLDRLRYEPIGYRVVNASYAGPLAEIRSRPLFRELHDLVLQQGGHVWLSTMSASAAVELGRGALSVAFVV